ncbi:MAG: small basic protein [Planctomycetota bacterium]
MSIHKSLKSKSTLIRSRNVLSRGERLASLLKEGRIQEETSVFGLPKVRVRVLKKVKKKKKKEEDAKTAGAETATTATTTAAVAGGEKKKEEKKKT